LQTGWLRGRCGILGGSQVVGPTARWSRRRPQMEEALLCAELDLNAVRRARLVTPLLGEERLDLTLQELKRIRRDRFADQR